MRERRQARGRVARGLSKGFPLIMAGLTFLITAALVLTGGLAVGSFDVNVGGVAPRTFVAPRRMLNEYALERAQDAAANAVEPVYIITGQVIMQLERFFVRIEAERVSYAFGLGSGFEEPAPFPGGGPARFTGGAIENIDVFPEDMRFLITSPEATYIAFRTAVMRLAEEAQSSETIDPERLVTINFSEHGLRNTADIYLAEHILTTALSAHLARDTNAEDEHRHRARLAVAPVYIQRGQVIVEADELITSEIFYLLEYFGYVNGGVTALLLYVGLGALVALIVGVMSLYIWLEHRAVVRGKKELSLLFTIYGLTVILVWFMSPLEYYFAPVLLFAVLATLLVNIKLAAVLTVATTLCAALIYGGGYEFLAYFLIMGLTVCSFGKLTADRGQVFRVSLLFALISAVTVASLHFVNRGQIADLPFNILPAVGVPVVIVIFAVGSLPFWEAVFRITTPNKLLELIGPDKPLIRRLASEAPGTYHHSLIVANLAETAALEVGANHVLARVGGFYHDIGKLRYPGYYSENINGPNPHDEIHPLSSTEIIIEHVENGLKLADKYKIPTIIRDFIEQHHGNTLMAYFYQKAKGIEGEDEPIEADYRYPHPPPASKEAAIVMLADTCEAAVRSVAPSGKDYAETKEFVRSLIKRKLDENQLAESGLSIRDLDVISDAFMGVFKGMYHDRVKYEKKEDEGRKDEKLKGERREDEENSA